MKYTLLFIFYQIKLLKMLSNSSAAETAADWSDMIKRHCCVQGSRLLVYIALRTRYNLYVRSSLLLCDNYILPTMSANERFVKADSRNLPKVDVFMIGEYLNKVIVTTLLKYSV
jgi:hypothetical protein